MKYGFTPGCAGCDAAKNESLEPKTHSMDCRVRIQEAMVRDEGDRLRLDAAARRRAAMPAVLPEDVDTPCASSSRAAPTRAAGEQDRGATASSGSRRKKLDVGDEERIEGEAIREAQHQETVPEPDESRGALVPDGGGDDLEILELWMNVATQAPRDELQGAHATCGGEQGPHGVQGVLLEGGGVRLERGLRHRLGHGMGPQPAGQPDQKEAAAGWRANAAEVAHRPTEVHGALLAVGVFYVHMDQ